ncbi:Rv3654c family TadE-like protein [Lapillicoccus sp.]|uniref:Rv3654c family TadE-like protein n=1 Tax=Lapillicoccus sp. TaxID=1909287 RepID=UPI003983D39A
MRHPGGQRLRGWQPETRERGSATVMVVAALGVLLTVGIGGLALVSAVVASHRAHAAADLAALSGAVALVSGDGAVAACSRADAITRANGATPLSCRAGSDQSIELVVSVRAGVVGVGTATARARAGPDPSVSGPSHIAVGG